MERIVSYFSIALVGLACFACDSPMEVAAQASAHTDDTSERGASPEPSTDQPDNLETANPAKTDRFPQPNLTTLAQSSEADDDSTNSEPESTLTGEVNLNRASRETLERLPGIGPVTAKRIDAYRSKRRFEAADDIKRIDGIGEATYEDLENYLTVSGETTLSE